MPTLPEVEHFLREQLLFRDDAWIATVDGIAASPPFDDETIALLASGALAGSAEAAAALGHHHYAGDIPNENAGIVWMRLAAEAGLARAQVTLVWWLLKRGETQEAMRWFMCACNSGADGIDALLPLLEDLTGANFIAGSIAYANIRPQVH